VDTQDTIHCTSLRRRFHPPLSHSLIITCIHHHFSTLPLSVHRSSSVFHASISFISQVVILMLSGLQHAPFYFLRVLSFPFGHTRSSISQSNCRFKVYSNRPMGVTTSHSFPFDKPTPFHQDTQPSPILSRLQILRFPSFLFFLHFLSLCVPSGLLPHCIWCFWADM